MEMAPKTTRAVSLLLSRWERKGTRFSGKVAWALSDSQAVDNPPAFPDAVDMIYLQFFECQKQLFHLI
jgi:hypothetical protein